MGYKFTEAARRDLRELTYYIALDNEAAANRVYERVLDTCEQATDIPELGRHLEFVPDPSILCINVKKYHQYYIFYRKQKSDVEIIRIIHGARDLPDIFSD